SLSPLPNRRVIDSETSVRHEFFRIAETQPEPPISSQTGKDHLRLELPFPEQGRPARLHAVTLPDSQHFQRTAVFRSERIQACRIHPQLAVASAVRTPSPKSPRIQET